MSEEQGDQRSILREVVDWLQSVTRGRSSGVGRTEWHAAMPASELLEKAAECYARANWAEDACRVFEYLGYDRRAALYHERLGRWKQAALCYTRAADWQGAARCYLRCDLPNEAAECLLKAGRLLQAAWVWASQTRRFQRAESTVREIALGSDVNRLAVELVLARCEAGTGSSTEAGRRLHNTVLQLPNLSPDVNHWWLYDWALELAQVLNRVDLTILIHSTAVAAGFPHSVERWERWAIDILGDATGVPEREEGSQIDIETG